MQRLKLVAFFLVFLPVGGLTHYELTEKSPELLGKSLPGWQKARQVDIATPWQGWTGLEPVDRFLHETAEAWAFYQLISQ